MNSLPAQIFRTSDRRRIASSSAPGAQPSRSSLMILVLTLVARLLARRSRLA